MAVIVAVLCHYIDMIFYVYNLPGNFQMDVQEYSTFLSLQQQERLLPLWHEDTLVTFIFPFPLG
jgi:hypothetical protein